MRLPGFLDRAIARRFGTFAIDDPRPIHDESPYTFYLPDPAEVAAVQAGDYVKAIFRPTPQNRKYDAERMWVKVESRDENGFTGVLNSEPYDMPQMPIGIRIYVPRTHVIDIDWREGKTPPTVFRHRTYWDRCYVDDCILRGASHVDYLYREQPDEVREGDTAPDSGWRFRGTNEGIAADERLGRSFSYIALGKVLNSDDRWLSLIDEPAGSAFQWNDASGEYYRTDD
jgi:hypothetical protein